MSGSAKWGSAEEIRTERFDVGESGTEVSSTGRHNVTEENKSEEVSTGVNKRGQ